MESVSLPPDFKLIHAAVQNVSERKKIFITGTEADAMKITDFLQKGLHLNHVISLPMLLETGIHRFESNRVICAKRVAAYHQIIQGNASTIVVSIASLLRFCPDMKLLMEQAVTLNSGEEHDIDILLAQLESSSYQRTQRVDDIGDLAIRGSILDIWPPGYDHPVRLEFFGDEVQKIRQFRVADQRSFQTLTAVTLLPLREFIWPKGEFLQESIEHFNQVILKKGLPGQLRSQLIENVRHAYGFSGVDDAYPDFLKQLRVPFWKRLFDYDANWELTPLASPEELKTHWHEAAQLYDSHYDSGKAKGYLCSRSDEIFPFAASFWNEAFVKENPIAPIPSLFSCLSENNNKKFLSRIENLYKLKAHFKSVCIVTPSPESAMEVRGLMARHWEGLPELTELIPFKLDDTLSGLQFFLGTLPTVCFVSPCGNILVVSQAWLQGVVKDDDVAIIEDNREQSRVAAETLMSLQFSEYSEGDLVVHVQHGIGRFVGIMTLKVMDISADFLSIEYHSGDKIYVPIHKMNLVQRYVGDSSASNLDSLRSQQWEKRKQKAKEDAEKLARELMNHQALRETTPAAAFSSLNDDYYEFEAAFPHDPTSDQLKAIKEIHQDLSRPKAMDRLLCGDVGFGKTEVAMRAAYRCVLQGKQVAVLVPTTVLAHQHIRSFKERFQGFGVECAVFDRSVGAALKNKTVENLKNGQIDIIIGTHRLLSDQLAFKDLGLLIVDEEQRFGVQQKEKIRRVSYGVHVLTMTATPIPRTLQFALLGLRDLSLLTTPPKARLATKTFVCPHDENLVKEAVTRELARGGQVFYVHNRVEELESVKTYLQQLVPQARLDTAHGKLSQKELEDKIVAFIDRKYDVLLCTTIIESGVDMPYVNTIIVQNADHFGLAQLYQLRGRVGRRSTRGFAYFLTSPHAQDADDGMKRLEILKEHQELGSGFVIASHDLELRGSGNILGEEQKGKVTDVGLETYTQMLSDAIKTLGGIKVRGEKEADITLPLPAQIPENYITNAKERLRMYRRFFGAQTENALVSLISECEDRFGPLPAEVTHIADMARLRRWLVTIGAVALVVKDDYTEIKMGSDIMQANDEDAQLIIKRILDLCNRQVKGARITPDGRILLPMKKRSFLQPDALRDLKYVLSQLAGETTS